MRIISFLKITKIIESIFTPKSTIKKLFAAYGLCVGLFIVFIGVFVVISPNLLEILLNSYVFYLVLLVLYGVSFLIVKDKIK